MSANEGAISIAQSGTVGSLSVGAGATVALTAHTGACKVLDTSSLSMAQTLVNAAFDNGAWDKPGITSSSVIADLGAYSVLAVMIYDNTVLGIDSFEGLNGLLTDNGGNQVMLKTTYLGDFDGNGIVNSADYDYGYGYQAYGVLAGGATTPAASAALAPSESVPEPGTLCLLLAGAAVRQSDFGFLRGKAGFQAQFGIRSRAKGAKHAKKRSYGVWSSHLEGECFRLLKFPPFLFFACLASFARDLWSFLNYRLMQKNLASDILLSSWMLALGTASSAKDQWGRAVFAFATGRQYRRYVCWQASGTESDLYLLSAQSAQCT